MFFATSRGSWFLISCLLLMGIPMIVGQNLDCDFEVDFCQWTQLSSDDMDWTLHRGPTPSPNTGPDHDHTNGSGYYAYLETSGSFPKDFRARLQSPVVTIAPTGACLSFYYHMYGMDMGSLNVYGPNNSTIWQKTGNIGNHWKLAKINLTQATNFQFVIEAVRGNGYRGDIAIDDITFTTKPCPKTVFGLDFISSPTSVSYPFTKELKINCSLKNKGAATAKMSGVQADQPVSQENLEHVISIVVTHEGTDVATVSQFEPARSFVDSNQLLVTGSVSDVTDAYLELTWQSPDNNQAGNYTCEMNVVNDFNHIVVLTKTLAVGVSDLTLERLAQVVEEQDKTISQLDNTIQTLQTTISQLETNVHNILNNSGLANQTLSSQHIETGYGNCGNSDHWQIFYNNVLYTTVTIQFDKPYNYFPRVETAISRIETTNNDTEGLRVWVSWSSTHNTFARISCYAENTHVKEMSFLWISQ